MKNTLGRLNCRWKDNISVDIRKAVCEYATGTNSNDGIELLDIMEDSSMKFEKSSAATTTTTILPVVLYACERGHLFFWKFQVSENNVFKKTLEARKDKVS
jgi:hypothetical protein